MQRICGNCVFCLIGISGERICSLYGQEDTSMDEDGNWIAGRLVNPEGKCHHNDGKAFRPVEPMVDEVKFLPGWHRKPNSRVLLEAQLTEECEEILPHLAEAHGNEYALSCFKVVVLVPYLDFVNRIGRLESVRQLLSGSSTETEEIRQILEKVDMLSSTITRWKLAKKLKQFCKY